MPITSRFVGKSWYWYYSADCGFPVQMAAIEVMFGLFVVVLVCAGVRESPVRWKLKSSMRQA